MYMNSLQKFKKLEVHLRGIFVDLPRKSTKTIKQKGCYTKCYG